MEVGVAVLMLIATVLGIVLISAKCKSRAWKIAGNVLLGVVAVSMVLYILAAVILVASID